MTQSHFPASSYATERNKVLQNALNLVGLSMIPTALAAWLVSLVPMSYYLENPILSLILFIISERKTPSFRSGIKAR